MHLSPDAVVFWQYGFFKLNATIVWSWILMAVLVIGSWLVTRRLSRDIKISRWQNVLEIIVIGTLDQIKQVGLPHPRKHIAFIGTMFLFLAVAALCTIFPFYEPPTGSLSTSTALAISVFIAVPLLGIEEQGLKGFLKTYIEPTPLMLPFNIIGEFSRTLAMAIRLFGNMMSGAMIMSILLVITPFIFPLVMSLLGLLSGVVQAYIFSIITTVYLTAAMKGESS
jgi:F-type H+-transporting ATPase subunit a